jgi:hypothetical protein
MAVRSSLLYQLYTAPLDPSNPIEIALHDHPARLYCTSALKTVSARRLIMAGTWDGQPVIAKLFLRRYHINRHIRREVKGSQRLQQASISTPTLLFNGKSADQSIGVVLYEQLLPALNLKTRWQATRSADEKCQLFRQLVQIVAAMHGSGITQKDIHLNNFLIHNRHIYTIDGADVIRIPTAGQRHRQRCLQNLGLLFAQLSARDCRALLPENWSAYCNLRHWPDDELGLLHFKKIVRQQQTWRFRKYFTRRKLLAPPHGQIIEAQSRRRLYARDKESAHLLRQAVRHLTHSLDRAQQEQTRDLAIRSYAFHHDGRDYRLREYRYRKWQGCLMGLWRGSPAVQAWCRYFRWRTLGVTHMLPVGILELRWGPLSRVSYLLTHQAVNTHSED